ncbi:MAG: hypothetical protein AAGJ18_21755, partial [Bacteroidota bacterium]
MFRQLSNGYYALQKQLLPSPFEDNYIISCIPIKWYYTESLSHLSPYFEAKAREAIPATIEISQQPTDFSILTQENEALAYLNAVDSLLPKRMLGWLLFLYLMGFVCLGMAINHITKQIIDRNKPWIGPAFLLTTVFGLRYLSLGWSTKFQDFQVFARSFEHPNISVGDLLINIILLLWVVLFIHKEAKDRDFTVDLSHKTRLFLTTLNYLSVVLALLLLISVLKSLVLNSGIDFDFKNVFSLDYYSVIAVFGVILLLFTQFVFSHRMLMTIHKLKLTRLWRYLALGLAILLALPVVYFIDLEIPVLYTALIAFIFVMAYDVYIDIPDPGLVWLSAWVILFAGFSSGLLYIYNTHKEVNKELFIAKQLATDRDSLAEMAIAKFVDNLADSIAAKSISSPQFLATNKAQSLFATLNFEQNYLYANYDYQVVGFYENGAPIAQNSTKTSLADWQSLIERAQPISGYKQLYLQKDTVGHATYLAVEKFSRDTSDTFFPQFIIQFTKAPRKQSKVFTNLLSHQEFKGLEDLSAYDYAIIKNKLPVVQQGMVAEEPNFIDIPSVGAYDKITQGESVYFMYRSADKDYVILKKPKNNLFHPVSLFSFIFGFLLLTVILVALINSRVAILPDNLNFQFWNKPSLRNRIQFSIILLTIAIFFVIAMVSVYFLTDSYSNYDKSRLSRKVTGLQTAAQQYLHQAKDSLALLSDYVEELSIAERIDFALFDLNGQLIQSSEMDIFQRGILPPLMNPYALQFLKKSGKADLQLEAAISDETFTSAFTNIVDSKGQTVAFMNVPYRNQQRTKTDDVVNFLGNLVNVYVFLLILAGVISVRVAEKITKPISTIGENLKEIKIGKSNE